MKSLIGKQAPAYLLATQDPPTFLPRSHRHLPKLILLISWIMAQLTLTWWSNLLYTGFENCKHYWRGADLTKYARDKNVWHLVHLLKRSCSQPSLVKVVKSAKLKWKVPSLKRLVISPLKPKYNPVCPLWAAPCYILWSQVPDLVVGLLEGSHCGRQAAHRLQSLTSS